jgi:hypothetical protein
MITAMSIWKDREIAETIKTSEAAEMWREYSHGQKFYSLVRIQTAKFFPVAIRLPGLFFKDNNNH